MRVEVGECLETTPDSPKINRIYSFRVIEEYFILCFFKGLGEKIRFFYSAEVVNN
jgi:hypothetical protein